MSRKNYHWQWLDICRADDISLTQFSVPLSLKPQQFPLNQSL